MRIFIHRDGQSFGPYTLAEAKHELANGSLQMREMASYDGYDGRLVPLAAVPGVAGNSSVGQPSGRWTYWGWMFVAVGVLFIVILAADLLSPDEHKGSSAAQASSTRNYSPREFGQRLAALYLNSVDTDIGTQGMYHFTQGCRRDNPTVRQYTPAEFKVFQDATLRTYIEWRTSGYHLSE